MFPYKVINPAQAVKGSLSLGKECSRPRKDFMRKTAFPNKVSHQYASRDRLEQWLVARTLRGMWVALLVEGLTPDFLAYNMISGMSD